MLFTFCYQICMFHVWFFIIICKIYQKYWNFDQKIGFLGLPGIKVWPNCLFLGSIIMSWAHTHGLGVQNWIRKKSEKNGSKLTPSTKAFSSFHRGCWLQMMHVFLTRKMDRRKYFDFCDSAIFHVVFHSATINDASGVLLLNPTLMLNSYYLCPFTIKISVWQCEMTGNVMKREGIELKWWLPFGSGIPSMWQ